MPNLDGCESMNKLFSVLLSISFVFPSFAAQYYDGSSAYASTFPTPISINPDDGTVSLWVYSSLPFTAGNSHLFLRSYDLSAGSVFDVYAFTDGNIYGGFYNGLSFTDGRVIINSITAGLTQNEWHHIALTWINGGDTDLWVDGSIKGTATFVSGSRWDPAGGDGINLGLYGTAGYTGYIDDVRIYRRKLRKQEIINLYLSRTRLVITDDLTAWWKLDDGADNQTCGPSGAVKDISGNGNTLFCSATGSVYPTWQASRWISYP